MRLNYNKMSSEMEEYKNAKIIDLKNQYNINHAITTNTYNELIYQVLNSRNKNKSFVMKMIVSRYNLEIQNLQNTLNSNIENVVNFTTNDIVNNYNNKNGILIGMNYVDTEYKVFGSLNNSIALKDKLMKTHKFNDIELFTDNTDNKPTKEDILQKFKKILINSNNNDFIFVFYSGLSFYFKKNNENTEDYKEENIIFNLHSSDHILNTEIKKLIENYLKADVTLFILLDACYNKNILDLNYQYLGDNVAYNNYIENKTNALETEGNIILINGFFDESNLNNNNNIVPGALTWSFLQTLSTNYNPTWRDVLINMHKLLEQSEYSVIPQFYTNTILNMDSKINF